jgi:hypothetical protein
VRDTNINHIEFNRGEDFLSITNKIFLSKRVYGKNIGADICAISFVLRVISLFVKNG